MRTTIETSDSLGTSYDISLLIKCIRVLSEIYDPDSQSNWSNTCELEGRCKNLKDKRNQSFHSVSGISNVDLIIEMGVIELMLMDILSSLEIIFPDKSYEIREMKKAIKDQINKILTQPLGEFHRVSILLEKARKVLSDEKPHYKERCREWGKLQMLEFLLGSKSLHQVKLLFTEVIVEKSDLQQQNTQVECTDILGMASDSSILLIESEAGGGKTTIFRYAINDWGEDGNSMNTQDYDYIFPMVFRNPYIRSIKDLIEDLFPKASNEIDMHYIMKCIMDPSQRILFFCDGYDEGNDNSRQLFNEICDMKRKYKNIRVILTSRPESVRELYYSLGSVYSIEHLKVLGIHEQNRGEFLKRYHDELISAGLSTQNSNDLLAFYESCSYRHRELYRLPINLVILAWLWAQDKEKAKSIKSAAGLYTAIIDILNAKLIYRILKSHLDVMSRFKGDIDRLIELIDMFKEIMYNVASESVRYDRIYIDSTGVRKLRKFCEDNGLPFLELKGAYLLSRLEWENANELREVLELPHKGFLDYYTAKVIESKLLLLVGNSRQNQIRKIIVDIYGEDFDNSVLPKYQNILLLLGGILALKDSNLVEKHGQDIIDVLVETGVTNNSQWYDTFSDVVVNKTAASKFGRLIAPNLNLNHFKINDPEVQILSTLLQYVDIDQVTIDIKSTIIPVGLPSLISLLNEKQSEITIEMINDDQIQLWDSVIKPDYEINVNKIMINTIHNHLPFLPYCTIGELCFKKLWREQVITAAPDLSGCDIEKLWAAVDTTNALPNTVRYLRLALMVNPTTGTSQDPGLAYLKERCPQLSHLGLHIQRGTTTDHLPSLPYGLRYGVSLFLSHLNGDQDIAWVVKTIKNLQPDKGSYRHLVLPRCELNGTQLSQLVRHLAAEGIKVKGAVVGSGPHIIREEEQQLKSVTDSLFKCPFSWFEDDTNLDYTGW